MSLNDRPELRKLFAGYTLKPVSTTYSLQGGGGLAAKELIISNEPKAFAGQRIRSSRGAR
jgi:DNA adenine methylase